MISEEQNKQPPLYGLVLAGGRSLRMGHDKSLIQWHGREQRYYLADMLQPLCSQVFISCRTEQLGDVDSAYQTIADSYDGAGPLIAILSAFRAHPHAAWFVVACDLPLLDTATLQQLVHERDTSGIATTYRSPHDALPEPLITIWEPPAYGVLLAHIDAGYKCPRKALILNDARVHIIDALNSDSLLNANTPADAEKAATLLAGK